MKEIKDKKENIQITINKEKLIKGIICVAIVALIVGLSFFASNSYASGFTQAEFTDITIDEYLNLMQQDEKSIVYVASPSCGYCNMETPILKRIAGEYDLEVYYLNTSNFYDQNIQDYTEDGYKFLNSNEVYNEGYGTPNTIIVGQGDIIDGIYQYVEAKELKDFFKENGFLNE